MQFNNLFKFKQIIATDNEGLFLVEWEDTVIDILDSTQRNTLNHYWDEVERIFYGSKLFTYRVEWKDSWIHETAFIDQRLLLEWDIEWSDIEY